MVLQLIHNNQNVARAGVVGQHRGKVVQVCVGSRNVQMHDMLQMYAQLLLKMYRTVRCLKRHACTAESDRGVTLMG